MKGLKKNLKRSIDYSNSRLLSSLSVTIKDAYSEDLIITNLHGCSLFFTATKLKPVKTLNMKKILKPLLTFPKVKYNFAGKAYRVKFYESAIFFKFHKSHPTYLFYSNKSLFFTFRKNKWVWLKTRFDLLSFQRFKRAISAIRPRNLYTGRGLWNNKAFLFKKKGKVSGYR